MKYKWHLEWLMLIAICLPTWSLAQGGTDIGRGGDSIALDLKSIALYNLEFLRQNPKLFKGVVDLDLLEQKILSTEIEVEERVFIGEDEKEAVNYSNPDRIVVGSKRWLQMDLNDPRKHALVFHEYVTLMELDDSDYALSAAFLRAFKEQKSLIPLYSCALIKDPKRTSEIRAQVRFGGPNGNPIGHLEADGIHAQIYAGGGGHGSLFLVTISDETKQIGMVDIPRIETFPKVISTYALDLGETYWQVYCAQ